MTPQREAYLAKCSKRELVLRHWIELQNVNIKAYKADFKKNPTKARRLLQTMKYELVVYRHELNRLKGMDNVVVPKQTKHEVLPKTTNRPAIMSKPYFVCKCGDTVGFMIGNEWQKATYCTHCGRRILWERVK